MTDSEWLAGWKKRCNDADKAKLAEMYHGDADSRAAVGKKRNDLTAQFMKEALEADDENISGLQVRCDSEVGEDLDGYYFFDNIIAISLVDEDPEFLYEDPHDVYSCPNDVFTVRASDMAEDAEHRDIMIDFLNRFTDNAKSKDGLYSPKDAEGNYIDVLGKDLHGYTDISENAERLSHDWDCIRTPEELEELRDIGRWMRSLEEWSNEFCSYEVTEQSISNDDCLEDFENGRNAAAIEFMGDAGWYADHYGGMDWAPLSDVHAKYVCNPDNYTGCDYIMINITRGEPFKDGATLTVFPAELAKDPDNRERMTKFLTHFTDMTEDDLNKRLADDFNKHLDENVKDHKAKGDIDKLKDSATYGGWNFEPEAAGNTEQMKFETKQRKPDPGMTTGGWTFESENADGTEKSQPCRNPIPDEWKDMAAGNGMQDVNDRGYGD